MRFFLEGGKILVNEIHSTVEEPHVNDCTISQFGPHLLEFLWYLFQPLEMFLPFERNGLVVAEDRLALSRRVKKVFLGKSKTVIGRVGVVTHVFHPPPPVLQGVERER